MRQKATSLQTNSKCDKIPASSCTGNSQDLSLIIDFFRQSYSSTAGVPSGLVKV